MSQDSLAEAMGTSQSAVARIESGRENITMDTLSRMVGSLHGRFSVSIVPEEYPFRTIPPWWESPIQQTHSQWNVVGFIAASTTQVDRMVIGLERPIETPLLAIANATPQE